MLELISIIGKDKWNNKIGLYKCYCGNEFKTLTSKVNSKHTKSCGCLKRKRMTKHGMHNSTENQIWRSLKYRCYNQNHKHYYNYGGRGIKVCDRWLNSFENFYKDMGPRPSLKHSVERKDNNGNYTPDNCVWATKKEQQNNMRTNKIIEYNGKSQTLAQWSDELGLDRNLLCCRLGRQKWSVEKAFTTPVLSSFEKYK